MYMDVIKLKLACGSEKCIIRIDNHMYMYF